MRQIPAAACVARFWAQPPKSGLAVVVHSRSGLLSGVAPVPPTPHPFLLGGVREGFGNALILERGSKDVSPALRRGFYLVLEALGGAHHEHQEHLRGAQGRLRTRLGNSLKSSGLQKSIKGPNAREIEPKLC